MIKEFFGRHQRWIHIQDYEIGHLYVKLRINVLAPLYRDKKQDGLEHDDCGAEQFDNWPEYSVSHIHIYIKW